MSGKVSPTVGTQEALNELAKRKEFTAILKEEAKERGLDVENIMASFARLDSVVSKPLAFNGHDIAVPYRGFTDVERAGLVTLLKLQEDWSDNFWVMEEQDPDESDSEEEYTGEGYSEYSY